MDFSQLKKNLKKSVEGFKTIRMAMLGDSATQFVTQAIKGMGVENSLNLEIFEAEFNQIDQQIFDLSSELYEFNAEVIFIFQSSHKLLQKYNKANVENRHFFAEENIGHIQQCLSVLQSKTNAKIIFCNFEEEDDRVFGQFANKVESSFIFQLRKLNYLLQELATQTSNLYICDLSTIQNVIGREKFWSPAVYTNTEMVVSIDALPYFADAVVKIITAFQGNFKKCIILDLDNTTWGGVIGDDGIENIQIGLLGIGKAFTEFQYWIKKLQQRGIIVAVCSKNTESIAKEPFEKHPDMVLRLSDITVFVANWENKADNIRKIQNVLNIGFDTLVFLDDNLAEREIVRQNLPTVCVPELPKDPAVWLEFLYGENLFETVSFSQEDKERTQQYREQAERTSFEQSFTNESDFLKSLEMKCEVECFTKFNIPRVAQLSQRSNQFNLRTVRYSEIDIQNLASNENYKNFAFSLKDKFGDNGLIAVVVLEKQGKNLFIESWFMSCRVLKRGMENLTLNTIVKYAKENKFEKIIGEYLPTAKNILVQNHYQNLNFVLLGDGKFELNVCDYAEKECFIEIKEK